MNLKISATNLRGGDINIIPSKSHLHRLMICEALAGLPIAPISSSSGTDIKATHSCLLELLRCLKDNTTPIFNCSESGSTLRFIMPIAAALFPYSTFKCISGLFSRPVYHFEGLEKDVENNCYHITKELSPGEFVVPGNITSQFVSGLIFALPLLNGDSRILIEGPSQSKDYIKMTIDAVSSFGITIETINESEFYIKGNQRYISSNEAIAKTRNTTYDKTVAPNISFFNSENDELRTESKSDATLTSSILDFNHNAIPLETKSDINDKYSQQNTNNNHTIPEGDWSSAAFWIAISSIGNLPIRIKGLSLNSIQGDKAIFEIARKMGASIYADNGEIRCNCKCKSNGEYNGSDKITTIVKSISNNNINHSCKYGCKNEIATISVANRLKAIDINASNLAINRLNAIDLDASNIPDLVPCIALMCSLATGTSFIRNCARLKFKESDRLLSISTALKNVGADISIIGDSLVVKGKEQLNGGISSSFNDHRIAMMLACSSVAALSPVQIIGAECVEKSYPSFFDDFRKIGGEIGEL